MAGARVLVVEDNPANMMLARDILELMGYHVLAAVTADAGIALARSEQPGLILMDVGLPGMDGLEATALLRSDSRTKDIPVVALTAHAMSGDEARARSAGCTAYVAKPFSVKEF